MRKMVNIRLVDDVQPIPGADRIEVATLGGWKVVTQKGNFRPGELGLYFEIDSWIPSELDPSLSRGLEPKVYNGVKGEKLRTIRLKKQISQGLLIPLRPEILSKIGFEVKDIGWFINVDDGYALRISPENIQELTKIDLSETLGVQKWEPQIDACLQGKARGNFPSWIRKTDQERAQNIPRRIFEEHKDTRYEVTIKMDGSSMTVYNKDGYVGVCSRNLDIDLNDEGNSMVRLAKETGLLDKMLKYPNTAIQGEICGPGIQKNKDNLNEPTFFLFDMFDISKFRYVDPWTREFDHRNVLSDKDFLGKEKIQHAKILHRDVTLADLGIHNMDDLLKFAEQPGYNSKWAEGVVFKSQDGQFTFKAISNKYLEKEED